MSTVAKVEIRWERLDGELSEIRRRYSEADCPRCGSLMEMEEVTEGWVSSRGRWRHNIYGPAQGECCGLLIVDCWDGARVFELESR